MSIETKMDFFKGKLSAVFNAMNSRDMQFAGFGLNTGLGVGALLASGGTLLVPVAMGLIGNLLCIYNLNHPYQKMEPVFNRSYAR